MKCLDNWTPTLEVKSTRLTPFQGSTVGDPTGRREKMELCQVLGRSANRVRKNTSGSNWHIHFVDDSKWQFLEVETM
jgi:hypothetical protein